MRSGSVLLRCEVLQAGLRSVQLVLRPLQEVLPPGLARRHLQQQVRMPQQLQ
ncbi:MAG: hypothetical protein WD875_19620 [Pirellulales bacterium]